MKMRVTTYFNLWDSRYVFLLPLNFPLTLSFSLAPSLVNSHYSMHLASALSGRMNDLDDDDPTESVRHSRKYLHRK